MNIYGTFIEDEENIPVIEYTDYIAMCILENSESEEVLNETVGQLIGKSDTINAIKDRLADVKELKNQWKKLRSSFVKHNYISRYINDKQKEMINKYYDILKQDDVKYGDYKKAFNFICKFMGIPRDKVIIEMLEFSKAKKDSEQEIVRVRYSKGLAKVHIPDGIQLLHVSPVEGITELIPSFRSKVKGKYLYPNKRCYFTAHANVNPKKAGLEKSKIFKYTPKNKISTAYIDPACADFKDGGAVYVQSDRPIPVVNLVLTGVKKVINRLI